MTYDHKRVNRNVACHAGVMLVGGDNIEDGIHAQVMNNGTQRRGEWRGGGRRFRAPAAAPETWSSRHRKVVSAHGPHDSNAHNTAVSLSKAGLCDELHGSHDMAAALLMDQGKFDTGWPRTPFAWVMQFPAIAKYGGMRMSESTILISGDLISESFDTH